MKPNCPHCQQEVNPSEPRNSVVCYGRFQRNSDHQLIQRYRCKTCGKSFSQATTDPCRWQKKRQLNEGVFLSLVSCVSMRRTALLFGVTRNTVVRKFLFVGNYSLKMLPEINATYPKVTSLEFDDLETFEHTKCKPLSATIAVESKTRRILGFRVARMPAKGLLAAISRKKYGYRKDERKAARTELFSELKSLVADGAVIKSDENPHYTEDVKRHFPTCQHKAYKGKRGCVTGQGELKRGGWDPIFALNHSYAMLRDNLKRLSRQTWCTTKKPERLALQIAMYAHFHNLILTQKKKKASGRRPFLFLSTI